MTWFRYCIPRYGASSRLLVWPIMFNTARQRNFASRLRSFLHFLAEGSFQMKRPKLLAKTGAVLMIAGTVCLVPLIASQRAHAQTSMAPSTTMKNVIPQAEEVTLQAKI